MRIIRSPSEAGSGFTQVPNLAVRDARLSFRARGVHAFLLSHVDEGWKSGAEFLSKHGKEGRDAIEKALSELESFGYIRREKRQNGFGKWFTDVYVFTLPGDESLVDGPVDK